MINDSYRRSSLLLCSLFCLGVGLITAVSLHYGYAQVRDSAERSLQHSSDLIAEWIVGAFAASDYVLRDIAGHVDPAQLLYPHPEPETQRRLTRLLIDKQSTVPHAFLVSALNAECIVTHSNAIIGFDASEREYCRVLRDDPTRQTVVTQGFISHTGQLNVTQARRLAADQGEFAGLVAIAVDLGFFSRRMERIEIATKASIAIIDHQGLVLARKPLREGAVGQTFVSSTVAAFLASQRPFALFNMRSPIDDVERWFGARRVAGLPFIVIVGLAPDEYMQTWRLQVLVSLSMLLMLWLLAIITLRKHWAMLQQSAQFAHMAREDTLTRLPNRRYFVELAERERQKARRQQMPLSLLMLDVDQFKQINDVHGHAAGDRALVAFKDACSSVLREVDIFGRWGGDEFVVLLPEGYATAQAVAERVRGAVKQIKVHNDKGQAFQLRTTIGFVSTVAGGASVPPLDELFSHADQALYAAKQAGRDQVRGVQIPTDP